MSNGFSAADMTTARAKGYRDASEGAAQEAVASVISYKPLERTAVITWAHVQNGGDPDWLRCGAKLFAAPVAAAPGIDLQERLSRAYSERNALAIAFARAAIAAGWPAGRGFDADASKDWDDDWRHVIYADLPNGAQVSWHVSPDEIAMIDGLPEYGGKWDGTFVARDPSWCQFDNSPNTDAKDAARYRYLRRPAAWAEDYISRRGAVSAVFVSDGKVGHATDMQVLDDAIDAEMQATSAEVGA